MSDDARIVANDPRAPAAERTDAHAQLARLYMPTRSDIARMGDMSPLIEGIRADLEESALLAKASSRIMTLDEGRIRGAPQRGMRSVYIDEFQTFANGDYYEKPSLLGFDQLRAMVEQTPILNAIVLTRIRQISRFCQVSEDGGMGFEIRHVDRKHKLDGGEMEATQKLSRFFANCGWEFNPRKRKSLRRDNFTQFMAKLVRDSLTMDACPIETEMKRDRSLGIDGLYAIDGATIRLCSEDGYQGDDEIYALQVIQGRLATAYTRDQLIYEVRNPRADVRLAGYGLSETELLIRVVTGFLNAMSYNIAGFDNNSVPKGILHMFGDFGADDIAAFKRQWNQIVKGINNAWALPVMVSKDKDSGASFEKFGVEFDEMYFSKWMTFLTSIACAIYGMDPAEINFESFSAQGKSSLAGSDTEERLANSKDSGLLPIMSFFEATLSDFVVSEFDEDFCFRWVGLQKEDEDRKWEAEKMILSVDELRAERGYKPWAEVNTAGADVGQAPLNPSLIGPWMQMQQPAQPEQQGPDFGEEDAGGGKQQGDQQDGQQDGQQDASGSEAPPDDESAKGAPDFGGGQQQGDFGAGQSAGGSDDGEPVAKAVDIFAIGGG